MKKLDKKTTIAKQQILFCIFSVFLLGLFLCGDLFITKFLPIEPNQEYFLENEFLSQVTLEEGIQLIQTEKEIYFFVGDKNILSNKLKWKPIYFIDFNKNDSKEFQNFLNDRTEISFENSMIFFFQNGVLQEIFEMEEKGF